MWNLFKVTNKDIIERLQWSRHGIFIDNSGVEYLWAVAPTSGKRNIFWNSASARKFSEAATRRYSSPGGILHVLQLAALLKTSEGIEREHWSEMCKVIPFSQNFLGRKFQTIWESFTEDFFFQILCTYKLQGTVTQIEKVPSLVCFKSVSKILHPNYL